MILTSSEDFYKALHKNFHSVSLTASWGIFNLLQTKTGRVAVYFTNAFSKKKISFYKTFWKCKWDSFPFSLNSFGYFGMPFCLLLTIFRTSSLKFQAVNQLLFGEPDIWQIDLQHTELLLLNSTNIFWVPVIWQPWLWSYHENKTDRILVSHFPFQ